MSRSPNHYKNKHMIPKILITVRGGLVEDISATRGEFEISVIDWDNEDQESSPVIYYKAKEPNNRITVAEYNQIIDDAEDEYLNQQDHE